MFYQLPPAGNAVQIPAPGEQPLAMETFWSPYHVRWYGSGTSALAAAIVAARQGRGAQSAEVLVPAYGCPDVISAVLCAGARPVLVDLVPNRPWLDIEDARRHVGPDTIAIVAINFLGIPERTNQLREFADNVGLALIEDCAQSFPWRPEEIGALRGDWVVLSFGRGKPVSLLGGGAVLSKTKHFDEMLPRPAVSSRQGDGDFRWRARLYNFLRHPRIYWLPQRLPFLRLGETIFVPHAAIEPPPGSIRYLAENAKQYRQQDNRIERLIRDVLRRLPPNSLVDLPEVCRYNADARLLRYPLLVGDMRTRDRADAALRAAGLGSSRMYQRSLSRIPGVTGAIRNVPPCPNAENFASALLTLPTHDQVRVDDVERMGLVLKRELGA